MTARNLTVDTAARFLIRNKLIDASAIVEGDVEIIDASRRNQSLKIVRRHGPSYFIKQAGEGEPDSRATIGREAWFYAYCQQRLSTAPLLDFLPRMRLWDEDRGLIVLELAGGRSLWSYYASSSKHDFPSDSGGPLGYCLGALHRLFRAEMRRDWIAGLCASPPWIVFAPRPTLDMLARLSPAHIRVLKLLQDDEALVAGLDLLRREWRPDTLVHNDLKGDNVLVDRIGDNPSVRLVDWELAQIGDAAWDVGSMLRDFLSYWLMSVPLSGDLTPEEMLAGAEIPLARLHPATRSFWEGYRASAEMEANAAGDFLLRSLRFAAARLAQGAYELCSNLPEPPNLAIAMLQLAANIMTDPRGASLYLFGITAGWRRATSAARGG